GRRLVGTSVECLQKGRWVASGARARGAMVRGARRDNRLREQRRAMEEDDGMPATAGLHDHWKSCSTASNLGIAYVFACWFQAGSGGGHQVLFGGFL
ncbi:hypothetical protein N9L68_09450, partial [bacterium]|nr:hypothetical protein [bacterium]